MLCRFLVISAAVVALLAGCGGDESQEPTATARPERTTAAKTRTPKPTLQPATATPKTVAAPARPASLDLYAETIADYLTEAGDTVLGKFCLQDLIDAWALPKPASDAWPCTAGNADGDSQEELALVIGDQPEDAEPGTTATWQIVVFDFQDDAYTVAYQSPPLLTDASIPLAKPALLALDDINDDGFGEIVYSVTDCGAHTCTTTVHIVGDGPGGYHSLSGEGIAMPTAEVSPVDRDGDGALELVMTGGVIGSVGAGPQRGRTEVYAWDGTQYTLVETTLDPTDILYLRVTEADALFAAGLYDQAFAAYDQARSDPALRAWKEQADMIAPERDELAAYSLFRMGLSSFGMSGLNPTGRAYIEQAVAVFLGTLHGDMSHAFLDTYDATNNVSLACGAARDFIAAHIDLFDAFWDYGYANPIFNAAAVCPF